ncbi:SWIM zinc finger family protein [Streptomyces alkaliterrae]|uniref:SWIM zinc finger family protein n=1 Tax=Streptomyces alkaliterrae TaxID=2213162 RepID=A0A5P0YPY8_9ACTN|nr:SWIM zinc finger family protein [Streptomyces alkaliterrae]MBB1257661.1 SWIM zinc finger family protein [Streptomyces alkaliterrae]MQS01492.1 hypothetical protein [Streptomyces alkaliterrae]
MDEAREERGARGFPAFAARRGGRARGRSFWAGAWTDAVEDTWTEEEPLKKGRSLARTGRIGPITVGPGRISAEIHDGGATHTAVVTLRELDDQEWELLWEKAADRPAVTEALLAGELPEDLLESVEDARLRLLPGYGDLEADCDCGALDHPCPHAAALCYQLSWLLDSEPSLLLLVRGRELAGAVEELKSELLLRAMTADAEADSDDADAEADSDGGADGTEDVPVADGGGSTGRARAPQDDVAPPGVDPVAAWAARGASPLPAPPPLPDRPAGADEPVTGIEADPLDRLVTDAAVRARGLLAYALGLTAEPAPPLDLWRDTVRVAATHPDPRVPARLRESCGRPPHELDRAAAAWRTGGPAGLDVLEHTWSPSAQETARARAALAAGWEADEPPELEVRDNHWTLTRQGLQLRLGRDGRWYPYRREADAWWPAGPPHADPSDALMDLVEA